MYAAQLLMQMAGANTGVWNLPVTSSGKSDSQDTSPSFQTLLQQHKSAAQSGGDPKEEPVSQAPVEDGMPQENGTEEHQTVSLDLAALSAALLANGICQIQTENGASVQPQAAVQPVSGEPVCTGEALSANAAVSDPEQMAVMPQTAQQMSEAGQDVQMTQLPGQTPTQAAESPVQEQRFSAVSDDASAAAGDQPGGETARQEDPAQAADSVLSWETPLFDQTEQMPVKVGDTVTVDTTEPAPQLEQSLGKVLEQGMEEGAQRLEIQLSPANLGTVTAEFVRSPEGALHVVLRAENPEAAKLLGDHAGALGLLLQDGTRGEVRVEVPQPQENQQPWQQPDQEGGHQQQQQQQRHAPREETESFLHQLRLGLVEMGPEEIM